MLPAVDKKCSKTKEKTYRKTKEKKSKHKLKHKTHKKSSVRTSNRNIVQYSDVSSEELSSSEAGEIHSDFDEKQGLLRFKPHKIVTDNLIITRVASPQSLLSACSPLSNNWEQDSIPESSSMSTNLSLNNGLMDMTSEHKRLKQKKSKKTVKKPKSPTTKKKKKKKEHKSDLKTGCDNSYVRFSTFSSLDLPKRNGDVLIESANNYQPPDELSLTPPLAKPAHLNISKVKVIHNEDETHNTKHLRKEDKR